MQALAQAITAAGWKMPAHLVPGQILRGDKYLVVNRRSLLAVESHLIEECARKAARILDDYDKSNGHDCEYDVVPMPYRDPRIPPTQYVGARRA